MCVLLIYDVTRMCMKREFKRSIFHRHSLWPVAENAKPEENIILTGDLSLIFFEKQSCIFEGYSNLTS